MDEQGTGMPAAPRVTIQAPSEVFGGELYSLYVEVLNSGNTPLGGVSVEPEYLAGREVSAQSGSGENKLSILRYLRSRILEEMTTQCEYAYLYHEGRKGLLNRIFFPIGMSFFDYLKIYSSKLKGRRLTFLPSWCRRAFDLKSIEDAGELEETVLSFLPETHKVRIAWHLNMKKLNRLDKKIKEHSKECQESKQSSTDLPVGGLMSMTFSIRAPITMTKKKRDSSFLVRYSAGSEGKEQITHKHISTKIEAAPASVLLGSFLGAIAGFIVRYAYLMTEPGWFSGTFFLDFAASALLGLLLAVLVRKSPNSKKPVTADDIYGGILLGAVSGLFTDKVIVVLSNWYGA